VGEQFGVLVQQAVQVGHGVAGGAAGEAELFVDGVQPDVLAAALGDDADALGVVGGERTLGRGAGGRGAGGTRAAAAAVW
jgi:hypothetical protein